MKWVGLACVLVLVLAGCSGKGPTAPPILPEGQLFQVQVRLVDDASGSPVSGTWRAEAGASLLGVGLAPDGASRIDVPAGLLVVHATADCRPAATARLHVAADAELEVRFGPVSAQGVGAPAVTAYEGPGAMTTLVWDAVDGAQGYQVVEGGRTYDVGGALAWGDHTPTASYGVQAIRCGTTGPATQVAADVPLLPPLPTLAAPVPATVEVSEHAYATFDATGASGPMQAWRVVQGTGNCCENYVATTRQGWIVDFGGDSVLVSKDEGLSWEIVTPHGYQGCGEGAIVPGPGGDLYAMNWEMCAGGAGNDQVWGLKYVAADDAWLDGIAPAHSPFFDRPWMSVSPGPHVGPDGSVWPVRSYIFSNFNDALYGAGHVVSGDGQLYHVDAPLLDTVGGDPYTLPGSLPFDADADWAQPYVGTFGRSLGPGLHVLRTGLLPCMVVDTPGGRACANRDLPLGSMQRDAAGRLHAATFDGRNVTYQWSDDVGLSWQELVMQAPANVSRVLEWDLKAHHQLDRAVVAVHAAVEDGATDYVFVLADISSTPRLERILQVGKDPGTAESGVAASGGRYDFMTSGFLPDGRVVLSFTDGDIHPPAVAIELPAAG